MCHQTIEKILKAYFSSKIDKTPPYTHNLSFLSQKSGIDELLNSAQKDFLDLLDPLNIEARYPTYKDQLFETLNEEKCTMIFEKTKELHQWIKEKL